MPKILGGSLSAHRTQTRERLFAALATLMAERGFDAITFAEIASTAGVGRTAVYNHFPDKEAVLLGYIRHETEQYLGSLELALVGIDDPVDQLRAYVRQQARLKRGFHPAHGTDLSVALSPETQARLRDHVVDVEVILRRILTAGIESGALPAQDLDTTMPLVHACLSGRGVPAATGPDRERAIDATETFVLRAVGALRPALV